MKRIGKERIFYYSTAIGISVNYKLRGSKWGYFNIGVMHFYMHRLPFTPFQAQISLGIGFWGNYATTRMPIDGEEFLCYRRYD